MKGKLLLTIFILFSFYFFSENYEFKKVKIEGLDYIDFKEVVKIYGGKFEKDPISHYPCWEINGKRVVFSTTSSIVSVDNKIVTLSGTSIEKEGSFFVSYDFLQKVLPLINLEKKTDTPKEEEKKETKDNQPLIEVDVSISFDLIRITFTGFMSSISEVKKEEDKLIIKFLRGNIEDREWNLGEGIANRMISSSEKKLVSIFLDKNFTKYETLYLKDPERLIVLLKGSGQRTIKTEKALSEISSTYQIKPYKKKKGGFLVVIDPGHGGQDTGAIAKDKTLEKDLTLKYAKKLKEILESKGIDVVLTRNEDIFIPLKERTAIANFNDADLFLSLHFNSSRFRGVRGAESYVMSKEASDSWSKEVAEKENYEVISSDYLEGLNLILWSLAQTRFIVQSTSMAYELQENLNNFFKTRDRGVKQAPFAVLEGATMPAILLEIAYLSNEDELKLIKDDKFMNDVLTVIADSILKFKDSNAPPKSDN